MPDKTVSLVGIRVKFGSDFYITRLLPLGKWAGTIVEERKSLSGQPTKNIVRLDECFRTDAGEMEVDVAEGEMERFERTTP